MLKLIFTMLSSKHIIILYVLSSFALNSLVIAQNDCPDSVENISIKEQVEQLTLYYNSIQEGKEEIKNEYLFFCYFPNSFERMKQVFGFDNKDGAAPLYYSGEYIELFYHLNKIERNTYYDKYINICINGVWEADNISECFGLFNKFFTQDVNILIKILNNKSEREIRSVFRFLFDGPHPSQREKDYLLLNRCICDKNKRLAKFLEEEYAKLIKEEK